MGWKRTTRRSFAAGSVTLLGGCLGGSGTSDSEETSDGGFERITVEGTGVPLVPVDTVHEWYEDDAARFADARGERAYDRSHVEGAVWSPAPDGRPSDPVAEWPTDARIVCYCGCPHHLSSLRASTLIDDGYEEVYVIDEGFWEWTDRGYPVAGANVDVRPELREISGVTDAAHAGETAWARHEPTGQREATAIDDAGEYHLELRFTDVTADSTIRVETPEYRVRAPLGDLVGTTVTGDVGELRG
ncbi:rhodanese-like domain-containing protein [Candidatus Halobonum tyrrellensis]|uniref:Rhodanese domain-containing protein n=1 Tax=Candidatus Halobonum tyrrellensis G22 TaxID=1324957 RepID=V4GWS4_9EURY|nr:rhodanese-like domain-containing protein [Candidatus Halobonum tyrrellensis]ESP89631.1 hypothetical protein K933_02901 [Candidatus Halobonum tyrrellensis G22]